MEHRHGITAEIASDPFGASNRVVTGVATRRYPTVTEVQFLVFVRARCDRAVKQAARVHYARGSRGGGVPIVVRAMVEVGVRAGGTQSQSSSRLSPQNQRVADAPMDRSSRIEHRRCQLGNGLYRLDEQRGVHGQRPVQ